MQYFSQGKQLTIDEFRSSLAKLPKSNRWVQMGDNLPWHEMEKVYNSKLLNSHSGAGNKSARMVIGALIIKHKMNLSDQETILAIQENPYMQYMLGLSEFTDEPIFDSSLFVTIRKRLSVSDLNDFSKLLFEQEMASKKEDEEEQKDQDDDNFIDSQGRSHKGDLKLDATCGDAEVRYPTDIDLLMDGSRLIDQYIRDICRRFSLSCPTTHFVQSRKSYLGAIKYKKKTKKIITACKSHMLRYLNLDIQSFLKLIAGNGSHLFDSLKDSQKRVCTAIFKMYAQQKQMFTAGINSCKDRIVSIFQSHIRPIVRGKSKAQTEFGAKIGVSVAYHYTFIDNHSWDAYNEASDLKDQITLYKTRFGALPSRVFADKIYLNRENRQHMKDLEIEVMGKPLGRPPKDQSADYKYKMKESVSLRNEVEATFGTAKRIYRADNIRAKLPQTADSWLAMCYFVKNVMKFLKRILRLLFLLLNLDKFRSCYWNQWNFRIESKVSWGVFQ